MHIRMLLVVLTALFALPLSTLAKDSTQTNQVLSLEQVVAIALKNSPGLNQQFNTVRSAEITVSQRQVDFYPDLNLNVSVSEDLDINVELSTSVNLFNRFADIADLRISELHLEADLENLSQKE